MKTVKLWRMVMIFTLVLTLLPAGALRAAPDAAAETTLADLVNADGALRLDGTFHGALDVSGWQVQLSPRGPIFAPTADPQWNALGGGTDGALASTVRALAVSGTDVYVGGEFEDAAGIPEADYIVRWDGTQWRALGGSGGEGALDDWVRALAVSGTDVYVGGDFLNAAGIAEADYVAKWDTVTSSWSALGSNGSGDGALNDWVRALAVSGTAVYVGGDFYNAANIPEADRVAKWDTNTSSWSALGGSGGVGALGSLVHALAVSGTDVYVGGRFTNAASIAEADYVAKWNGTQWSALGSNGSGNGALTDWVNALAVSGTDVYVGGDFTNAAGIAEADYVAKWDGSAWSALGGSGGVGALGSTVYALAVSGTDVYVGGAFLNAAGIPEADQVAKWATATSSWSALGGSGGVGALNGYVRALAVSGTDVYVGGDFTNAAGIAAADYVARWGEPAATSVTCTATGNGDWNNAATWDCGHVPTATDNVVIPAGATVTLDGDIELGANLDVQGTLVPNGKMVTLTGDQPQTLSGNLTFHNLTINKTNATDTVTVTSGKLTSTGRTRIRKGKLITASDYENLDIDTEGTLQLGNDITIGGNLVVAGTLDTNRFGVTFDGGKEQNLTLVGVTTFDALTVAAGTTLIETESGDHAVVGETLTNNGVIRKTQMIDTATDYYFGLASQDELLIDVTTDNFTSITVERRDQNHAGRTGTGAPPASGVGWGIYWTITPVGTGVADLILPHTLGASHADAQACRFISGTTWDCARMTSDDYTVTREGISAFSDWAVGNNVKANAVTLRNFRAAPGFDLAAWLRNLLRR